MLCHVDTIFYTCVYLVKVWQQLQCRSGCYDRLKHILAMLELFIWSQLGICWHTGDYI